MMRFEEKLLDTVIEFGRNMYQEILESIEQTVKKLIHGLEVEMPEDIPEKKKRIKNLHILTDEDHVALQFYRKKEDLQISENSRKNNTVM